MTVTVAGMGTFRELTVSCSCNTATHTFSVPVSSLPLSSHLCSCDTSRRISGSLLTSYVNISHDQSALKPDLSALTPYHSSDRLIRHFCSTCGTHMYLEYHNDGHFEAATGTLQVDDMEGVVEYQSCMWVEDTKDGGASDWLTTIKEKEIRRWTQEARESDEIPLDHYNTLKDALNSSSKSIHAHCQCKGVEFHIQTPNAASKTARSDFPDLMVPYHLGLEASVNACSAQWWLRDNNTRFLAGTCACNSCRRASGFCITFWAFVPTVNIFLDPDLTRPFPMYGPGHRNKYWGTIKTYHSSDGVTRTFCGRCGANIFWDGGEEKGRDGLIDVAVGLLDAESGARAKELLRWWTDRVSFKEYAVNKSLVRAMGDGLEAWEQRKREISAPTMPL